MKKKELIKQLRVIDNDILDIHTAICQALVDTSDKQENDKELERLLEVHRNDAFITCDEKCFCWKVERYILERQLNELA